MTDVTSRWRWVVLAASFFTLFLTGYANYHVGVMNVALLRHLGGDVSLTTWLMSYYAGSFALTAPVGSVMINLTSCRTCVVTSGLVCLLGFVLCSLVSDLTYLFFTFTLLGIGQGMCNTGAIVILGYYFPDQASIASGVSISGGALGIFFHPPLLQFLVDWYGLQGALLLSGAIAFQGSVFGALMRPSSLERKAIHSRQGGNVLQKLCALVAVRRGGQRSPLMSRAMLLFLLSVFIFSIGFHSLLVLLPHHLVHVGGLTPTEASFAVSVTGVGSLISRLATGFLAHDARVGHVLLYCGLNGVHGLLSLAAPPLIALGIGGSYAYSFMMGLYSGGVFTLYLPFLRHIVGIHHCATALGLAFFIFGVAGLVGAPLTKLVHGKSSHTYVMFGFVGAVFFITSMLGCLVTTVLPSALTTSTGQLDETSLPTSKHPEEQLQLSEIQTHLREKQTNDDSKNAVENDTNTEKFQLTKDIIYNSDGTRGRTLPEVTRPLLGRVAEMQISVEDGHVIDESRLERRES